MGIGPENNTSSPAEFKELRKSNEISDCCQGVPLEFNIRVLCEQEAGGGSGVF